MSKGIIALLRGWLAKAGARLRRRQSKSPHQLAALGEQAAARHLASRGYRLLERNYRCPLGEIDLVALHGQTLVLVEVKARTSAQYGTPSEAITPRKRSRLARLADHYQSVRLGRFWPCRFDLVEVEMDPTGRVLQVGLIPGAFSADPPVRRRR